MAIDARPNTRVAQQALFMLEDESLADAAARVDRAYEICFARKPDVNEKQHALEFLARIQRATSSAPSVSWPESNNDKEEIDGVSHALRSLCHVLLASNEYIYVQ